MRNVTIKGILLIVLMLLLTGCQTSNIKDDLAVAEAVTAAQIGDEWAELMSERYDVATVFGIKGQGPIGKALADSLRQKGFGIITGEEPQSDTRLLPPVSQLELEVRSDNIGKTGLLVSLLVGNQIINRSYLIVQGLAAANSQYTQLSVEGVE